MVTTYIQVAHIYIYTYIHAYIYECACACKCAFLRMNTRTHIKHACTHTHTHTYVWQDTHCLKVCIQRSRACIWQQNSCSNIWHRQKVVMLMNACVSRSYAYREGEHVYDKRAVVSIFDNVRMLYTFIWCHAYVCMCVVRLCIQRRRACVGQQNNWFNVSHDIQFAYRLDIDMDIQRLVNISHHHNCINHLCEDMLMHTCGIILYVYIHIYIYIYIYIYICFGI